MTNANQKRLRIDDLITVEPVTDNQGKAFQAWKKDEKNLVLSGCAGTGKSFTALYLALELVMDKKQPWKQIVLVRSVVPTREMGYLPGTEDEKMDPYTAPYKSICADLFDHPTAFDVLEAMGILRFESTSFIRGQTFNDTIIVVDEMQNLNFHELDSVITRVGQNTRIIFNGDYYQSDFKQKKDQDGIKKFLDILELMKSFEIVEFKWSDICRSDFVRDYIVTKDFVERGKTDELQQLN